MKFIRTPHQLKNTPPHEAVLPLYCSSSAQEAIHHTTHWIRVLHHNDGPNQYKPCVSCVVHGASLETAARLWACFGREKIFMHTLEFDLKGFAGARYPTSSYARIKTIATALGQC